MITSMMKTSSTLTIYACLYISFFLTSTHATTFDIHNNCPYTVWAAAVPGGSRRLDRGQAWTINVTSGTTGGRIWARTNCNFDNNDRGRCQTGGCDGVFQCTGTDQPPHTRAEYALNLARNLDFFYISLVDGFNVPMEFRSKSGSCHVIRCTADIIGQCPDNLKVPGGCTNPCTVRDCGPTQLTRFFKERCPDAYSYPRDDQTSRFTCPVGTNYRVVFCP